MRLCFALQLLSTLGMFGVIWLVQIAHYPLFARIPPSAFIAYETVYANRMGYIAGPLMLAELFSAGMLLLPAFRPAAIAATESWAGFLLVVLLWASTAFIQVPLHNRLHAGFELNVIHALVRTNWLRTAAWTARTALVLIWTDRLLR